MDDQQRLRYSRHLLLDEFGEEAQERLLASHALVIGAGGLGSSALMFLASSGVGRITVADGDKVELTNLQRQIAHRVASIGENKAVSAASTAQPNTALSTAVASRPSPAATPTAAVSQMPAAVVRPLIWLSSRSLMMAPAPRKPMPDATPCSTRDMSSYGKPAW